MQGRRAARSGRSQGRGEQGGRENGAGGAGRDRAMQPGLAVIISTTRGSFGPYATAALQVITPPDILNSRALNLLMNLYSIQKKKNRP